MNVTLSLERIEEMALCIVHNQLDEDEACEYARTMAIECDSDNAIDVNEDEE